MGIDGLSDPDEIDVSCMHVALVGMYKCTIIAEMLSLSLVQKNGYISK